MGLLRLSISSWMNFYRLQFLRNWSTTSKLSNMCTCLSYPFKVCGGLAFWILLICTFFLFTFVRIDRLLTRLTKVKREMIQYTLYDFNSLKFIKVPFMTQNIVYLVKCSMCTWQECGSCNCWVECSININ